MKVAAVFYGNDGAVRDHEVARGYRGRLEDVGESSCEIRMQQNAAASGVRYGGGCDKHGRVRGVGSGIVLVGWGDGVGCCGFEHDGDGDGSNQGGSSGESAGWIEGFR